MFGKIYVLFTSQYACDYFCTKGVYVLVFWFDSFSQIGHLLQSSNTVVVLCHVWGDEIQCWMEFSPCIWLDSYSSIWVRFESIYFYSLSYFVLRLALSNFYLTTIRIRMFDWLRTDYSKCRLIWTICIHIWTVDRLHVYVCDAYYKFGTPSKIIIICISHEYCCELHSVNIKYSEKKRALLKISYIMICIR